VINESKRKYNCIENLERLPDGIDETAYYSLETSFRAHQYEQVIRDSFQSICKGLTDRERLMLLLRYEDELPLKEIARLLGVHQSTVTRRLKETQQKLRCEIISNLASKHRLGLAAITECIEEIMENSAHSILTFIKQP
jgi:RNA polymerase sigma factor (sigma-70 family)